MDILLVLSGFIFACLVALLYECKIRILLKSQNKVHFYVTCEIGEHSNIKRILWLGKPEYNKKRRKWYSNSSGNLISDTGLFISYGLRYEDFEDMKEGEIREVFIKMED